MTLHCDGLIGDRVVVAFLEIHLIYHDLQHGNGIAPVLLIDRFRKLLLHKRLDLGAYRDLGGGKLDHRRLYRGGNETLRYEVLRIRHVAEDPRRSSRFHLERNGDLGSVYRNFLRRFAPDLRHDLRILLLVVYKLDRLNERYLQVKALRYDVFRDLTEGGAHSRISRGHDRKAASDDEDRDADYDARGHDAL